MSLPHDQDRRFSKARMTNPMSVRACALFDEAVSKLGLKNDAALATALDVSPPVISKLRNGHLPVGAGMILALHELTGKDIKIMKRQLGQRVVGDPK